MNASALRDIWTRVMFFKFSKLRRVQFENLKNITSDHISRIIIQQIVTLSKYGHDALDICHP